MKIAVTGKGGVGKSTLAGILAHLAHDDGKVVLAVDADPDANLAFALGIPQEERNSIIPISRQTELIEERTGAKLKQFGQIFKINPHVDDVAAKYSHDFSGIHLLVLGAIKEGGSGCACPENVFLRQLLNNIILKSEDFVIVDMEAGIEHLGRASSSGVDVMMIVVEPSSQSIATAQSIGRLAAQIGVSKFKYVGNKIRSDEERYFVYSHLGPEQILGMIPYSDRIRNADIHGTSVYEQLGGTELKVFTDIYQNLIRQC